MTRRGRERWQVGWAVLNKVTLEKYDLSKDFLMSLSRLVEYYFEINEDDKNDENVLSYDAVNELQYTLSDVIYFNF